MKFISFLFVFLLSTLFSFAQNDTSRFGDKVLLPFTTHQIYSGKGLDMAIFSTASYSENGKSAELSTLRFSLFFNAGYHLHYDLTRYSGVFSGFDLKNIGYIHKENGVTTKRRVYAIGVPIGVKIGDLRNHNFVFGGVGFDFPINYKEKVIEGRGNKDKFNEWFSDRTPWVMPYLFMGKSWKRGFSLKLQYYPGHFMNDEYRDLQTSVSPYEDLHVHLCLISLGYDVQKINKNNIHINMKPRKVVAGLF